MENHFNMAISQQPVNHPIRVYHIPKHQLKDERISMDDVITAIAKHMGYESSGNGRIRRTAYDIPKTYIRILDGVPLGFKYNPEASVISVHRVIPVFEFTEI